MENNIFEPPEDEADVEPSFDEDIIAKVTSTGNFAFALDFDDLDDTESGYSKLLDHVCDELTRSEDTMNAYYDRWCAAEESLYNQITTKQKYDANGCELKKADDEINFPLNWSLLQTIVAYMMQVFVAREFFVEVGVLKESDRLKAKRVQKKLQAEFVYNRGVEMAFRWFHSSFTYGIGPIEISWDKIDRNVHVLSETDDSLTGPVGGAVGLEGPVTRNVEEHTVYEGNTINVIDPFGFFPDPNVPMADVALKGDFIYYREFPSKSKLRRMSYDEDYVKPEKDAMQRPDRAWDNDSQHVLDRATINNTKNVQIDRGSTYIIPEDYWTAEELEELGVVDADRPQMWYLVVLNKSQILWASPFESDHGMHPFVVLEPFGDGLTHTPLSLYDLIGTLENTANFLVRSRINGTKVALNQKIVYNPALIDIDNFTKTDGGVYIPLKRSGLETAAGNAIADFTPKPDTSRNFTDLELIIKIADMILGTNDNLRGQVNSGGRKSATEVRTSNQQSSGRQSVNAMRSSSQGVNVLGTIMVTNNVQFLSEDFEQELFGLDGMDESEKISLADFATHFTFPVHDGTMPHDKQALLEQWAQIFQAALGDPELRTQYNVGKLFEHIAVLGGADDIQSFRATTSGPATQPGIPAGPAGPPQPNPGT